MSLLVDAEGIVMSTATSNEKTPGQLKGGAVGWETVNVFVSSTFNDMHAERDYLVKEVFPRLREWCERRKLRLVDVDLRWGVTEADATKHKRVVDVCLRKIDDCRPFFICLLGQRYGWIPKRGDLADQTLHDFPGLDKVIEAASVTELEVLHSCVEPMSNHDRAEHAFFYLRQPTYVDRLPKQPAQLARTYTDQVEKDPKSCAFLVAKQGELRKVKIPATGRPVHFYEASWDPDQKTPEIAMPLQCGATIEDNQKEWRRKWFEEAGVNVKGLDVAEDAGELAKAEAHNADLTKGRLGDFRCDGRSLGEVICEDLQAAITARFPDHVEATDQTDLEREIALHEEFVYAATEGFIERTDDFDALDAWANAPADRRLMAVVAPGGVGKSTLLAKWVQRRRDRGETVVCRFIGVGDRSASVDTLLHFLVDELRASGRLTAEVSDDPRKLRGLLSDLLADCGNKGKTVVVLDALDQLESGLLDLDWLPLALPENVKLLVSFKRGEPGADKLEAQWRSGARVRVHEHRGFEVLEDRKKLVRAYLNQFLKELDEEHLQALTSAPGADNPLFLRVVLSELRVFGAFGDLGRKIRDDFGDTPVSAFNAVLQRLESDPPPAGLDPRQIVPILFGLLAHSRAGLPKQALLDMLVEELGASAELHPAVEATVETYLRQVRPFLARREGRVDFFYASFCAAAQERYARADAPLPMRTTAAWHKCIAHWCERWPGIEDAGKSYALGALVHHLLAAGEADPAADAMTDFGYHYARLEKLGADDVIEVTRDFAALMQAELPADRCEQVETWQRFCGEIAHFLRRPGIAPEVEWMQKAYAYAESSPTTRSAETWLDRCGSKHWWFRRLGRPKEIIRNACLRVLEGHTDRVMSVALHADGRRAVTASADHTSRVWDLDTGACLTTLEGHTDSVWSVALHADGRRAVTASADHASRVWDLDTGACLTTLDGHTDKIWSVALHADGRRAVTASADHTLRVWDLDTGACLTTLEGHTGEVLSVALHPDGRRAVSGSDDKTARVWDLDTGACLTTLEGLTGNVNSVALHPDGRRVVTGHQHLSGVRVWDLNTGACLSAPWWGQSHIGEVNLVALHPDGRRAVTARHHRQDSERWVWDLETGRYLRTLEAQTKYDVTTSVAFCADGQRAVAWSPSRVWVWDLDTGACLRTLEGHTDYVNSVALHADGRRAVSASDDKTAWVWDLDADVCLRAPEGHTHWVNSVALHADGRRAVTASNDSTVRVWDLDTGACLRTLSGHAHSVDEVVLHGDGRRAVTLGGDQTARVWDLNTGECLRTLDGHTFGFNSVALHPDGRRAVTAGNDFSVRVWDLDSGACLRTLNGHTQRVKSVALHADGRRAVTGSHDKTVRVWDLDSGECLRTLNGHTDSVKSVALHADGRRAVTASEDETMRVWDLDSGECLRTLEAHTVVYSLAICADGRRAVTASRDHTVRVWDLDSGECLRMLEVPTGGVRLVALHADGRRVVTGGDDQTVRLWDLDSGDCLGAWFGGRAFYALCSGRHLVDGRSRIAAGCDDGSVLFFDLMPPGPLTRTTFATWSPTHPLIASVLDTGAIVLHQWHVSSGQLEELARSAPSSVPISSLRFTLDGTRLQILTADNTEHILDAATLQPAPAPTCAWSSARDVSPDGASRAVIRDGRLVVDR
jgi:WD40 repeat protein